MRFLSLALLAAGLTLASAPGAEAADRPGQRQVQGAAPLRRAMAQPVIQRSGPVRGPIGVARDQRAASSGVCASRRGKGCKAPARMNWTQGLAPAAGIQANECPDGTMAIPARGHEDIIRCMPI